MKNIFEVFDEQIGEDGYYKILLDELFKSASNIATFSSNFKTYRKGSLFSRVRHINDEEAQEFFEGKITKDEFYPPKLHKANISQGRFNAKNIRTLYLADHPFIAMKECDIEAYQKFLLSYIKLSTDMHFFYAKESKDTFTNMIHQLIHSKDTKFYPVINKINDKILKFKEFQGMVYDSVKIQIGHEDQAWGVIPTSKNFAIYNEHIKDTKLVAAWLCHCDENLIIYQNTLYKPLSRKKKNKLMHLNFSSNKNLFIRENTQVMNKLNDCYKKTSRLLDMGYYSDVNQFPIKVL